MSFTSLKAALFVSLNIVYLKNSIGVTNVVKETEKEGKKKKKKADQDLLILDDRKEKSSLTGAELKFLSPRKFSDIVVNKENDLKFTGSVPHKFS